MITMHTKIENEEEPRRPTGGSPERERRKRPRNKIIICISPLSGKDEDEVTMASVSKKSEMKNDHRKTDCNECV